MKNILLLRLFKLTTLVITLYCFSGCNSTGTDTKVKTDSAQSSTKPHAKLSSVLPRDAYLQYLSDYTDSVQNCNSYRSVNYSIPYDTFLNYYNRYSGGSTSGGVRIFYGLYHDCIVFIIGVTPTGDLAVTPASYRVLYGSPFKQINQEEAISYMCDYYHHVLIDSLPQTPDNFKAIWYSFEEFHLLYIDNNTLNDHPPLSYCFIHGFDATRHNHVPVMCMMNKHHKKLVDGATVPGAGSYYHNAFDVGEACPTHCGGLNIDCVSSKK